MRNETLIAPVGPAASSSAWATVWPTSRLSSSDSGDWARQRRTKSRMSGIEDGLAGNVCDTTTTGTTSMFSLIVLSAFSIATVRSGTPATPPQMPGRHHEGTWTRPVRRVAAGRQICPAGRLFCLVVYQRQVYDGLAGCESVATDSRPTSDEMNGANGGDPRQRPAGAWRERTRLLQGYLLTPGYPCAPTSSSPPHLLARTRAGSQPKGGMP